MNADLEAQLRTECLFILEGVCPRCYGPLDRQALRGREYGVCETCDLGFTASVRGELWSWQESGLWWLRDEEPPPIDPDAPVIDLARFGVQVDP